MSGAGPEEFPDTKASSRSSSSRVAARRPGNVSFSGERIDALLARAEASLGEHPRHALRHAEAARRLAATAGLPRRAGLALRLAAHALKGLERHEEALPLYAEARRVFLKAGDRLEAARTQIGRVDALMYLDRYDEARGVGRAALGELRSLGEPLRAGRLLTNLGNLEHRRDRPLEALRLYRQARSLLAEAGSARDVATVDYNLGNIFIVLDRLADAEERLIAARDAASDVEDAVLVLHADYALAGLDILRARYPSALRRLGDCESRFAAMDHERGRCNCLLDRAEAYRRLRLDADAAHAAEEARRGFRRLRLVSEETRATAVAGIAAVRSGDSATGRRLLARAEARFRELGNRVQSAAVSLRRAQASERAGRGDRDLPGALARAAGVFRRGGYVELAVEAEVERARLALQSGDANTARRVLAAARRRLRTLGRPELEAEAARLEALRLEAGDPRAAAAEATRALTLAERARTRLEAAEFVSAFLRDRRGFYRDVVRLAAFAPDTGVDVVFDLVSRVDQAVASEASRGARSPKAIETAEVARLRDRLAALTAPARSDVPREGTLALSAAARARIRRTERAFVEAVRRARLAAGDDADRAAICSLRDLQRALGPGDLWVHPIDAGDRIYVLSVTANDARLDREGVSRERLAALNDDLVYQVERVQVDPEWTARHADALRAAAERALQRLGEAIVPRVAAVRDATRLLVRCGAGVEAIPWGALPDGDAPIWVARPVVLVPDAATFVNARAGRVGAPVLRRPMLWGVRDPSVPGAETEVRRLGARLPGSRVFVGDEATRESFLDHAGEATLLHVAGHGVFRHDNPLFSALRFPDRDLLFLDIESLALRAGLVVLSSCSSGATRDELGLGTGLTRGFLRAGARNLLVSPWRISDAATVGMVEAIYEGLAGRSPAEALRSAALGIRESGAHPAFWASFQLVGTGR